MNCIGFNSKDEFLPTFDKFHCIKNRRKMFLKLFNLEVDEEISFKKNEIKVCVDNSLFKIFINKIIKNLQIDSYSKSFVFKVDVEKTNTINSFLCNLTSNTNIIFNKVPIKNSLLDNNIDIAVKLIEILDKNDFSFYLEGEKSFKSFVSNKILKSALEREVFINDDSIDIKSELHSFSTKIFTFWEFIDSKKLQISEHINKAVDCIENSDFKQVYLVYPKCENFNKHIQIKTDKVSCEEYEIKLIPYSLRSTLR